MNDEVRSIIQLKSTESYLKTNCEWLPAKVVDT